MWTRQERTTRRKNYKKKELQDQVASISQERKHNLAFWNSIFLTVQRFSLLLDLLKHFKDYHKSHSRPYGHIWLLLLVLKSSYLLLNCW